MIKVVLDTNVLISALITKGKPRALLLEVLNGKAQLVISREILEEFAEVAAEKKVRKYIDENDVAKFLKILNNIMMMVKIKSRFKFVEKDPSDDVVLRTAFDGGADYIISGDEHILALGQFRGIEILSVDEILKLL